MANSVTGLIAGLSMVRAHRRVLGRWPNVFTPRTYNERIIHRALFDRNPELRQMSDKIAVKDIVAERAGPQYVIPLLGVWPDADAVRFDDLKGAYVLKPNAQSGPFAIVPDGDLADREGLRKTMRTWFGKDSPSRLPALEWGYHGIEPRIMAEPFALGPDGGPADELDVYVFQGKVQLLRILKGRKKSKQRRDAWFDRNGRQVAVAGQKIKSRSASLESGVREQAIWLAEAVAAGSAHLRVDLYLTRDGVKVGELTPYSWAGRVRWVPASLDRLLGDWWEFPADASVLHDYVPKLSETRERWKPVGARRIVAQWLSAWERAIGERDFATARALFASDVYACGSLGAIMLGIEELEQQQWRPVWTVTRGFRFIDPRTSSSADGSTHFVVSRWSSEGEDGEGGWYPRSGRCTLILMSSPDGLQCIHSHFSMDEGSDALRGRRL